MVLSRQSGEGVPCPSPVQLLTAFNFSLFPVKDKKATGPWTAYQNARAPIETLQRWQESGSDYAIATGPISGVVVVDTDTPEAEEWAEANLPVTPWVVLTGVNPGTGFRGRHRYYLYPPGDSPIGNRASIEVGPLRRRVVDGRRVGTGLDLRGQGGYVVAPGSSHPSGVRYEVTKEWRPEDKDRLPVFDPAWFDAPAKQPEKAPATPRQVTGPTASPYDRAVKWLSKRDLPFEGERNHAVYSTAASLFDFGLSLSDVEGLLQDWNRGFSSPLPEDEVRRTVASAETGRQTPHYPKGSKVGTGGSQSSSRPRSNGETAEAEELPHEDQWEEVRPLRSNALPAFPLEVFAPWSREYLEALTQTLQTPTDFAGMFFLGGLATAFQKRFRLVVKPGWEEPLPLWVLLAASSGSRKSQAFREVMKPFNAWQNYMKEQFAPIQRSAKRKVKTLTAEVEQLRRSKKSPAHVIAEKEEELDELFVPPFPRLFTGSGTPEAIGSKMEEHHGRYALATAESDILAVLMGKYRSGGAPPIEGFLSGWSGEDIRNDFQRGDLDVTEAHLSMVLATQPENAADLYGQKKLSGRGALGRFLTVLPYTENEDTWRDEEVPPALESAFRDGVGKLLPSFDETVTTYCERSLETKELQFSPEALEIFKAFFDRIQKRRKVGGDLQFMDEWAAKVCGQCARIAALLHLADHPGREPEPIVPKSPVERAVFLTEHYLIPHARGIMGSAVSLQVEKVWSVLQDLGPRINRRDLQQVVRPMKAVQLNHILDSLEQNGFLKVEEVDTGRRGRNPEVILLNPKAPKSLAQIAQIRKTRSNGLTTGDNLGKESCPNTAQIMPTKETGFSGQILAKFGQPKLTPSKPHNQAIQEPQNNLGNLGNGSGVEDECAGPEDLPEGWDGGIL